MTGEVLAATLDCMEGMVRDRQPERVAITFHGGEPLSAGIDFFEQALAQIYERLGNYPLTLKLQSNLWLLDAPFCRLLRKYSVAVGTSLDGPEASTDRQRGRGYYQQTMQGIELARQYGLDVGCIATLTPATLDRWQTVVDFFISQRLNLSLHAAAPSLSGRRHPHILTPQAYAEILPRILDYYLEKQKEIQISSLDQIVRGVCFGRGEVCTFRDCLGMFIVFDPQGHIYGCQRFCGHQAYKLGDVADKPDIDTLMQSPAARHLTAIRDEIKKQCGSCGHWAYCKGGCLYNSLQAGSRAASPDPYCPAYQKAFQTVQTRFVHAMQTPEAVRFMAKGSEGPAPAGLPPQGLLSLLNPEQPPSRTARHAKKIVAAVELARGKPATDIASMFVARGWSTRIATAMASVTDLQNALQQPFWKMNNLYLHITEDCQLHCGHCYATAGRVGSHHEAMALGSILAFIDQAKQIGFRQVVVTGGEPLLFRERRDLFHRLIAIQRRINPMQLVLRTNFSMALDAAVMQKIASAFDQVVVSLDGDREMHDTRRSAGSYDAVVANLKKYQANTASVPGAAKLSIAAVLEPGEDGENAARAVVRLAGRMKIRRTRLRPMLPLGRAKSRPLQPAAGTLNHWMDPMRALEKGLHITSNCGLGQNLYIAPSGDAYPCYAHAGHEDLLGNVAEEGIETIIRSPRFRQWAARHVDRDPRCRLCEYRYLCGGLCHAWNRESTDCSALQEKSRQIYLASLNFLGVKDTGEIATG